MIALLGALEQEIAWLRGHLLIGKAVREPGCDICEGEYQGRGVLLVRTGIGGRRAEAAARLACQRYSLRALVSFGFAGALSPELEVGDVVICRRLWRGGSGPADAPEALDSDPGLVSLATETGPRLVGETVTVGRVVERRAERDRLAQTYGAQVVEMESYWVARAAAEGGVPFLAVRIVSDAVTQELPQFSRFLDPGGRLVWRRALWYLAPRPAQLWRLLRLRHNTSPAARGLGLFMERLLARLGAD